MVRNGCKGVGGVRLVTCRLGKAKKGGLGRWEEMHMRWELLARAGACLPIPWFWFWFWQMVEQVVSREHIQVDMVTD